MKNAFSCRRGQQPLDCWFHQQLLCQGCPTWWQTGSRAGQAQWLLINTQTLLENKMLQWDLGQQDLFRENFLTIIPKLTSHEAAGALTSCHRFPPGSYPCISPSADHGKCRALPLQVTDMTKPISYLLPCPGKRQSPSKKSHPVLTHSIRHNQIKSQQAKAV